MLYDTTPTVVTLTQAQYDALDTADKMNGTIYLITDINGTGDKFQPIIYSEEEREVGVWENGKPIYKKSFVFTTALSLAADQSWVATNFNITNIELIVKSELIRAAQSGAVAHNSNVLNGNIRLSTSTVNRDITAGSTLTVYYTKSTDAAGSGTWTPQGVPAIHYSNDEHIVGTWIDGSTLYEKTVVTGGSVPSGATLIERIFQTGYDTIRYTKSS